MNIYLVTKNQWKMKAAQFAFEGTHITLLPADREYPEIQAHTSIEIARAAAQQAARDYQAPAIREDHSIYINALGMPGPYISFAEHQMSPETLVQAMTGFNDKSGYFEIAAAYATPEGKITDYIFRIPFTLADKPRGTLQSGWNQVIILDGETRTLAEYPESERTAMWSKNFLAIAQALRV